MLFEPKWKSLLANTVGPIFTPEQCQDIINVGHQQKSEEAKVGTKKGVREGKHDTKMRITTISWIPFKALPDMYKRIEHSMLQVNGNHFGMKACRLLSKLNLQSILKEDFMTGIWMPTLIVDMNLRFEKYQ